jgi:hypothetical protein
LHRLAYNVTIDDAVDVGFRMAGRTQAFRRQIRLIVIEAGIFGGVAFAAAWIFYTPAPSAGDFLIGRRAWN